MVSREHPWKGCLRLSTLQGLEKRNLRPSGSQVCPHHIIMTDVDATSCLGRQIFILMN